MPDFLRACEEAARLGGEILQSWRKRFTAREKGPSDLVTEADLASQQAIQEFLAKEFPGFDFLGEESSPTANQPRMSDYRWIVDPLDGTVNYVHGLPNYGVSVALEHAGKIIAGVVYDPTGDECFAAAAGQGATLNGDPITPSRVKSLDQALVVASFPPKVQRHSVEVRRFTEVLVRSQSVRRLGSAALNLCYVAAGRLDAYWATSVQIWDIAAGILLLEESGAALRSLEGGKFQMERPQMIAASTAALAAELSAVLLSV